MQHPSAVFALISGLVVVVGLKVVMNFAFDVVRIVAGVVIVVFLVVLTVVVVGFAVVGGTEHFTDSSAEVHAPLTRHFQPVIVLLSGQRPVVLVFAV